MSDPCEWGIAAGQCVRIIVLGESEQPIPATVKNISGRGLGLELTRPLDTGTALKVLLDDAMLLGEAIYCRNQGANGMSAWNSSRHSVDSLSWRPP